MPNYSLVINSQFQPFSYAELAAPIMEMSNYHEKLAQEYDNLSRQADVLEAMGKDDRDKVSGAYSKYKSYSDDLRREADNLYKFGLNTESRQRLTDMRRRFNTDIIPIQNAWNKREQEADTQMKAQLQNPSLMFTRDARSTALDDYVNNPTGGYGVINGANITAQMSAMAKNLEKQILSGSGRREDIDEYTYNYIKKYGLTPDMIRDWRNNPTLSKMFEQVMEANGVTPEALNGSLNAQNIIDKSTGYAEMGMWNAVGEDRAEKIENYGARLEAQAQKELQVAMAKKAMEQENQTPDADIAIPGDTFDINFNDPESAGNAMKHNLATATYSYLKASKKPGAKALLDKYGSKEEAIQHFETEGIDGDELKKAGVYYALGDHIRNNITKNEDIINIWRSGMAKEAKAPISNNDSYSRTTYGGLDMYGNPISEDTYNATVRVPGKGTQAGVKPGTKDWKNINELSSTGYKVKAIQLNDQPTALEHFLDRTLDRNYRNGKVKLFDIKKIKGDGTYEYGDATKIEDLPHNSSGKEIDYKRIHRAMLSNGDYLLYWKDDKGQTQEKVLRRSDIGEQAVRDWANTDTGYKSALNLYTQGKISREQFNELSRRLGINNMANAYLDTQEIDVEDFKLK